MKDRRYSKQREFILLVVSVLYLLSTFIIWNINIISILNINSTIYHISNIILFLALILNIDKVILDKKYKVVKPLIIIILVLLLTSLFIMHKSRAITHIFSIIPVFILYVLAYQLNAKKIITIGFNSLLILFSIYNILGLIGAVFKFDYFFGIIPNILTDNYRYSSILTNPNAFGEFAFIGLWISTFFLIKTDKNVLRVLYIIAAILGLSAIFISMSRNALLMVGVLVIILLIFSKDFNKTIRSLLYSSVALATLAVALLMIINFEFFKDLFRIFQGLTDRGEIWIFVLESIKNNFCCGIGYGNGTMILALENRFEVSQAHNLYLAILFEVGIFGFLLIIRYILVNTFRPLKYKKYTKEHSLILLFIFAFLVAVLFGQFFEFSIFKIASLNTFIFILFAISATLTREVKTEGIYRPKVVHLITGLESGGAEAMLYKLMKYADHVKYRYKLIAMATSDFYYSRLKELNVEVITLNMNSKKHLLASPFRLYYHLFRVDVVQTWLYYANVAGLIFGKLAGAKKIIWGLRQSDISYEHNKKWLVKTARLSKYISFLPDVILSNSDSTTKTHIELGYYKKSFITIYNGFELDYYKPNLEERTRQRKILNLGSYLTFINVARYDIQKDHKMLLSALRLLKEEYKILDFKLILVGKGMDDANLELSSLIKENNLREEVILLGERVDINNLLNAADYFLLSSLGEGFPNVLGEAMATGLIPISTDVGDTSLLVNDIGTLCKPQNPNSFSKAIKDVISLDKDAQQALKEKAIKHIKTYFDIKKITRAYEDLYS